jgi:hypothetical protein
MRFNGRRFFGIMCIWESVYILITFPNPLPWEQYLPCLLIALLGAFILSLQNETGVRRDD